MLHMLSFLHLIVPHVLFSRGGGGGSGGGGGGGGGGSGSGGILLVGYIPAHYVTNWLYNQISPRVGLIGGIITSLIVSVVFIILSPGLGILVAIGAGIGVYSGMHNLLTRLKDKIFKSKQVMTAAAARDGVWQEAAIQDRITDVFYAFQQDWSDFNLERMRTYTADKYYDHMRLMLTALQQMGRQNTVGEVQLADSSVVEAMDAKFDSDDTFTAHIKASAQDQLIDVESNTVLFTDDNPFEEYWRFQRRGDDWILADIQQATANAGLAQPLLARFAETNGMYYSLDMGWLLLPLRGQLFGKAQFGRSDVNNHVIGEWDGLIVQLYTYNPQASFQRTGYEYLIGQITLPKSYGGIIVKRRKKADWLSMAPNGYQPISMEWPDFNSRYTVYATDMDKVTSFELLNPGFMAKLYDDNLPINIEVVDNVVYFYCQTNTATDNYDKMLDVLQRAYKELKM